jgi:dephospho-CoA kinase
MIVLGLTGSIGMGKSTTAAMFAEAGVPVWDADAAVHRLYGPGGAGSDALAALVPEAVGEAGTDRSRLRAAILAEPGLLAQVEAAIHPLVAADRAAFLDRARAEGQALVLCDIPLLYETGAERWLDRVAVVTAPAEIQRERVLSRPGMTEEAFAAILAKQVPDEEKRARADFVIDTGQGLDPVRQQVAEIVAKLRAGPRAGPGGAAHA